jgi:SAM-dependent methyltransferase/tRNA A-37 threonylcarbamoyl transferase component Bud32
MKQHLEILSPMIQEYLQDDLAGDPGFDQVWDAFHGEIIDQNQGRQVERIQTRSWTGYLKRFEGIQAKNHRKLTKSTEPRVATQTEREVRIMEALEQAGFGVPQILVWGSETADGRERRSLLLTKELPATALDQLPPDQLDRSLLTRVATTLGQTVAAGIYLPDLGLDHIYVDDDDRLYLLDFHNARTRPAPSRRELGRALIRFFRSPRAEVARKALSFEEFASHYLEAAGRPEAMARALGLARKRLDGGVGGDSSWRYEEPGKAAAFAARSSKRDREEQALLTRLLASPVGKVDLGRCLDAGCGAGRLEDLVAEQDGIWLGMDASLEMLLQAKRDGHGPLLRGNVAQIPFADQAFDTVFCFRLLHHLEPDVQTQVLTELGRVCRGRLILSAFHPISTHEWSRAFKTRFLGATRGRFPTAPGHLARSLPGFTQTALLRQGALRDLYLSLWTRA